MISKEYKLNLIPKKYLGDGWYSINTWKSYLDSFVEYIPSENSITTNYNRAKNSFYSLAHSNMYQSLLKEIMAEEGEQSSGITLDKVIEQTLSYIQNQGNLWQYVQKNKVRMSIPKGEAERIGARWQSILDLAQQEQWTSVSKELERIQSLLSSLNNAIQASSNGSVNMGKVFGKGGNAEGSSIAASIQGTLNSLRGKLLEEKAVEFLSKNLPQDFKGGIYQTGSIQIGGKNIKEDVMAILDDLEIVNDQGEVIYIFSKGKIIPTDKAPKKDVISLTEQEYKRLQDAALGMSAKTSKKSTVYHGGLNIRQYLDSVSAGDPSIFQLIHMYQLGVGNKHTLYQKYAVSKNIEYILGAKNVFMISRNKIVPTYTFIEKLMIKPLKFGTPILPKRGENAPLNIDFGSTNITGISSYE